MTIEPTADEIERVETAIRRTFRELNPSWTSIARAAILAMDRRAAPPAVAVGELDDKWKRACAAQSRKLQYVLCIPGVKEALDELKWERP